MNAFIALAVVFLLIGITSHLFAGIFKILVMDDFKMDKKWYEFNPRFRDLHLDWADKKKNKKKIVFKAAFLIFVFIGNSFFLLALVLLVINYFRR